MKSLFSLTTISIIKLCVLCFIAATSLIALAPDEAQYWTWSQTLDLGYYSKPPGISWQIFLTTSLFGDNEWAIRFGAMLMGMALTYAIYFLAKAASLSSKEAFFAAVAFALSPMGFYLSFAATTDAGALLFLTLACIPIAKGLSEGRAPSYLWVGLLVGLGALFKWTLFFLWPLVLVGCIFFPPLRNKKLLGGMAISILGILPSLYWNMHHEWATFHHVLSTLFLPKGVSKGGNFFDYLVGQIGLFSPLFFVGLCLAIGHIRKKSSRPLSFFLLFVGGALVMLLLSLNKKMQPNWPLFLYPPCMILIGLFFAQKTRLFWVATVLSLCMIFTSIALPIVQAYDLLPLSFKLNPYRQSMGVRKLTQFLLDKGYDPEKDFLFADKYQNSSLLSFYGPLQKRAYFFNLCGMRKNQFTYWPQMEEKEKGKRGFFLVLENRKEGELGYYEREYYEKLAPYFSSVTFLGSEPLFHACGEGVRYALLFRCEEYAGLAPLQVNRY